MLAVLLPTKLLLVSAGEPVGAAPAPQLLAGKYNPDKTRVWGTATLRKLQRGEAAAQRNRFAEVALTWGLGLIEGVAGTGKGAGIFRGQAIVMGRFLGTVATFCRCARLTTAAAPLTAAALELLLVRFPPPPLLPFPSLLHVFACACACACAAVRATR